MRYCIDKNNNRLDVFDVLNMPTETYYCPICHSELILKNGDIITPHFAHKSIKDCDDFTHDMSDWHKEWQDLFPKENQEAIISLDIDELTYHKESINYEFDDYKTYYDTHEKFEELILTKPEDLKILHITHRADVCIGKYVIEFQHSPISRKEFNKRNWFYTKAGYKLIWIFDFTNEMNDNNENLYAYEEWYGKNEEGSKYKWKNPKTIFKNFIPQKNKDIVILLQTSNPNDYIEDYLDCDMSFFDINCIQKVVWAIENEDGYSNFKRFITSYYPSNKTEFKEYILKNKI